MSLLYYTVSGYTQSYTDNSRLELDYVEIKTGLLPFLKLSDVKLAKQSVPQLAVFTVQMLHCMTNSQENTQVNVQPFLDLCSNEKASKRKNILQRFSMT